MRGRAPYGFDTEPIVMDGIKTKRLIETAEMEYAELMYEMYAEPETSYGDITRYFTENEIQVYPYRQPQRPNSLVLFGHFCFFGGLSHPAPVSRSALPVQISLTPNLNRRITRWKLPSRDTAAK